MGKTEIHAAMVPWLGFGHLIPFRQLAIALAQKGILVSFFSTPKNIQRLEKIPTELASLINMVELQLPVDKTVLLNGAEAGVDIPYEKTAALSGAYDLLKPMFKQFVVQNSLDWIILDAQSDWVAEVAKECGVKAIMFSVFPAAFLTFMGLFGDLKEEREKRLRLLPESILKAPEWVDFPSTVAYRRHENGFQFLHRKNVKSFSVRLAKVLDTCQAIAIRSSHLVDSDYLRVLGNIAKKPIIPVGLLFREHTKTNQKGIWGNMFEWLDEQEPRSVVFVGFGSECKLVKEEVHEIAYGLEMSKLPFVWILQNPDWDITEDEDDGPLPSGFRSRTSKQGVVKFGWGPQMEILAHPSVACSLFHSGWGSAIETIQHGVCLVVLPFIYDQGLNARLFVEKGFAIEVDRDENGFFKRNDIAKSLRAAMVSGEGQELKNKAAFILEEYSQLHQDHYLAPFVDYLKN